MASTVSGKGIDHYKWYRLLSEKASTVKNGIACLQKGKLRRQSLMELWEHGHHEKLIHPIKGELRKAWEIGSVWATCCNAFYGMYYDDESTEYRPFFLGRSEKGALTRVNHVKSLLPSN